MAENSSAILQRQRPAFFCAGGPSGVPADTTNTGKGGCKQRHADPYKFPTRRFLKFRRRDASSESSLSAVQGTGPTNQLSGELAAPGHPPEPVAIAMDDLEHPGDATISAAFQPSLRIDDRLPDLIIVSANNVYFYVHRHRIANASANDFGGLLLFSPGAQARGFNLPTLRLPESGDTLNVVLHTLYGLSCLHFHPTLETVDAALTALTKYGTSVQALAAPYQPLNALILSHAPYRPIETYALVGHYQLDELAVAISGHLLSFDLSTVTDALATRMGPVYLKRLFLLHQVRIHALKEIILRPPGGHAQAPGCSDAEQAKLTRAWALATAQLVWDATPSKAYPDFEPFCWPQAENSRTASLSIVGISPNSLRALLEPIADTLACEACKNMLRQRVQEVVYSWSQVTPTI
ncbi:hypothetical protein C8Q79DRAFT_1104060 [Trametes meyenii]|nr:hypothetical protein C8Q79DRAFT_1104060 [Trametes meyenii]